jgi:hypothetical protein
MEKKKAGRPAGTKTDTFLTRRIVIRFGENLFGRLTKRAREQEKTLVAYIRDALARALDNSEAKK